MRIYFEAEQEDRTRNENMKKNNRVRTCVTQCWQWTTSASIIVNVKPNPVKRTEGKDESQEEKIKWDVGIHP